MSFNRHLISSLALAAIVAPSLAKADAPAAKWYDKVSVGGYAEAYYLQSLNHPVSTAVSPSYRAFDKNSNQFTTNADLSFKYADDASKTGALVEFGYGPEFNTIVNANNGATSSSPQTLEVIQANVNQTLGSLTLTLGKFATPVGYEVWGTPSNANFSRGLLYNAEPVYHQGLKLDYALPAGFTVSGLFDNGNSIDKAPSGAKNWGAVVAYSGVKNLALTGVWYEDIAASWSGANFVPTHFLDFVATYTASDALSLGGEYLYTTTISPVTNAVNPKSMGYALYATYGIKGLSISPRFEQWFTPDSTTLNGGSTTPTYEVSDYTLTVKYPMGPLTHILEYRANVSNAAEFSIDNEPKAQYQDQTITYAATYSF